MLQGCLCQQFLSSHSYTLEFSAYTMLKWMLSLALSESQLKKNKMLENIELKLSYELLLINISIFLSVLKM